MAMSNLTVISIAMAPNLRLLQGSIEGSSMMAVDNGGLNSSKRMGFTFVIKKPLIFEDLAGQLFALVNI